MMGDDHERPPDDLVIDTADVDAKLIKIRQRGSLHFTGGDLELLQSHFGKRLDQLDPVENAIGAAYIYLRRAGYEPTWEMAANDVVLEPETEAPNPTGGPNSGISPPSATTGG
jgi:hypothetical protein